MNKILTSTAMIALMFGAAPAMAECNIGQTTQYSKQDDAVKAPAARRDLRELRDSAMLLKTYGQDEACQSVVTAIEKIRDNRGMATKTNVDMGNKVEKTAENAANEAANAMDWSTAMDQARPVTEMQGKLTVEKMLDADLRGTKGQVVGEISDVIMSTEGKPSLAVVSFGGFLGLGEDRVAIPFNKLKIHTAMADDDDLTFFVPMTEQQLQNAPRIKTGDSNWLTDDSWTDKNEEYYEKNSVES
jgi:hypothetical protein